MNLVAFRFTQIERYKPPVLDARMVKKNRPPLTHFFFLENSFLDSLFRERQPRISSTLIRKEPPCHALCIDSVTNHSYSYHFRGCLWHQKYRMEIGMHKLNYNRSTSNSVWITRTWQPTNSRSKLSIWMVHKIQSRMRTGFSIIFFFFFDFSFSAKTSGLF